MGQLFQVILGYRQQFEKIALQSGTILEEVVHGETHQKKLNQEIEQI